ncbi:MAG: DUF1501 domain-containing protein [Planctomycetota bacterium]|nr:DUF1501 domain-containing protein [Planctomycetota bacterium]
MCEQCDPIQKTVSRREILRYGAGGAAAAAMLASPLGRAFADEDGRNLPGTAEGTDQVDKSIANRGKAKQVIMLFMSGGATHLDTFDPKPGAPTQGDTRAIDTAVSGVKIAKSLPELAKRMGDIALIRGMTSKEGNHERARYLMHTGYAPTPTVVHAGLGSIVSHEMGRKEAALPEYIAINGPGARPGYMGVHHAPFAIQVRAPEGGTDERGRRNQRGRGGSSAVVQNLVLPAGVDKARRDDRIGFLEKLNARFGKDRTKGMGEAQSAMFERARRLMDTPQNTAFDLASEKPETIARYGKTRFGMGCLMARRLIDEGVKCVEVMMGGWDTHDDGFNKVRGLNEQLDPAVSALMDDLKRSGKLDETLIVWVGDFGRTPRIDTGRNGRGHYPRAWSAWLAGGGVQGGRVIGKTDAKGETVTEGHVKPEDFYASVAHAAGIDGSKTFYTGQGRPIQIVYKDGRVVKDVFA